MKACIVLLTCFCFALSAQAQTSATYEVTFNSTWSAATHPTDFPGNPHYSGMKGVTHNGSVSFWSPGTLASPGIELMAETGNNSTLNTEMNDAVTAGTAEFIVNGTGLSPSPGSISKTFTISQSHPLVTFVAMIAPSPDWFVGVHDEPLYVNGNWVDKTITAFAYDAGTDDGVTYSSPNAESTPHVNIFQITGSPINGVAVGTYTFTQQSLPVELTEFTAQVDNDEVILSWTTASEINNDGFAIERRAKIDVVDQNIAFDSFEEIGFVNGAGSTSSEQAYRFTDTTAEPGIHQYRLRQVDRDGTISYSAIVEIEIDLADAFLLSGAYPNPFNPASTFTLQVSESQDVTIELYDVLGQQVDVLFSGALSAGSPRSFVIDGSALPAGLYLYRATGERFVDQKSVTLIK